MFHAALQRTGVAAHNVIHVGDDPEHDIQGAREVGMHTVWMNSRDKEWPDTPRASREITRLQQLPQAIAEIAGSR
jgi:FMN phosphatase YigB (HAD superfamily)